MTRYIITPSEMYAYELLNRATSMSNQNNISQIQDAADKIIELAERIKTERLRLLIDHNIKD